MQAIKNLDHDSSGQIPPKMGAAAGGAEITGDIAAVGDAEDQAFQTLLPLNLL